MRDLTETLMTAALLFVVTGCGGRGGPTTPARPDGALSESVGTAHMEFHFAPGDAVDSTWQESFHVWATDELGVSSAGIVHYYKYRDRDHMMALTGQAANGWADPGARAVHTIWGRDTHEVIHVYTAEVGRPSDYFNEGVAVAFPFDPVGGDMRPLWSGEQVHAVARRHQQDGRLLPISLAVESEAFRRYDESLGYPQAGSFVRWLIDTDGMERLMALFAAGRRDDTRTRIEASFAAIYGRSLSEAEAAWQLFLEAWSG